MSSFTRFRSNFRSRPVDYQALPLNSNSNSPLSPSAPPIRALLPRRNRYTLLSILLVAIPTILFVASRHRSEVDEYVKYGQDRLSGWTGESEGIIWVEKVKDWSQGCRGWDPDSPEEEDPEGCLKAKQYRQTMRVLEREEVAAQYAHHPSTPCGATSTPEGEA